MISPNNILSLLLVCLRLLILANYPLSHQLMVLLLVFFGFFICLINIIFIASFFNSFFLLLFQFTNLFLVTITKSFINLSFFWNFLLFILGTSTDWCDGPSYGSCSASVVLPFPFSFFLNNDNYFHSIFSLKSLFPSCHFSNRLYFILFFSYQVSLSVFFLLNRIFLGINFVFLVFSYFMHPFALL